MHRTDCKSEQQGAGQMAQDTGSDEEAALAGAMAGLPQEFAGFAEVYERRIRPQLIEREGERVRAARMARTATWAGGGVGVLGALTGFFALSMPMVAIVSIVIGFAIVAIGRVALERLKKEARTLIVGPVAEHFGLDFTPFPGKVASVLDLRRIGLLPSYDRSSFEDRMTGARNGVDFEFFEAHLKERRTSHSSNGGTRTKYVTVFKGQCLRFDFHKRFFGETLVTRDAGFLNRFGGRKGLERAGLEDPEFEKAFEVYTSDQVEARFLLTPDMMHRLIGLERAFAGSKLRCAFSGQNAFIAMEADNLFEPGSLFKPMDNPARMHRLLEDFSAVFHLIDTLSKGRAREEAARGQPHQIGADETAASERSNSSL